MRARLAARGNRCIPVAPAAPTAAAAAPAALWFKWLTHPPPCCRCVQACARHALGTGEGWRPHGRGGGGGQGQDRPAAPSPRPLHALPPRALPGEGWTRRQRQRRERVVPTVSAQRARLLRHRGHCPGCGDQGRPLGQGRLGDPALRDRCLHVSSCPCSSDRNRTAPGACTAWATLRHATRRHVPTRVLPPLAPHSSSAGGGGGDGGGGASLWWWRWQRRGPLHYCGSAASMCMRRRSVVRRGGGRGMRTCSGGGEAGRIASVEKRVSGK